MGKSLDKATLEAIKCDRCHKLDVPACVASCPTKALVLVDDIISEKRKKMVLEEAGKEA